MGISAFLALLMAKEKDKIGLRPVDEENERALRFVRLNPERAEEVEELPPMRVVEEEAPAARLVPALKEGPKMRSAEPGIGSLIEKDEPQDVEPWDAPAAKREPFPWGWLALLGCIFAGAILWSLVEVNRSEKRSDRIVGHAEKILDKELREEMDAERLVEGIGAVLKAFFDSDSVREMARHVRYPGRVVPLMESHYGTKPPVPVGLSRIVSLEPLTVGNHAIFWIATCELGNGQSVQVVVEAVSMDHAKVDWETYVFYQPMDWDEFAQTRPAGYTGDFRVYVEPDHFYSHDFSDSATLLSFRLTAVKSTETLYGYTLRGGGVAKAMEEAIERNGGEATPMILRLRLPEGVSSKRGVVIKELVSPRWLFVENPHEESP